MAATLVRIASRHLISANPNKILVRERRFESGLELASRVSEARASAAGLEASESDTQTRESRAGKNISSQVVVCLLGGGQPSRDLGVAHFAARNLPSDNEQNISGEGAPTSRLGELETMARKLEAYQAALIAAGLPLPTLPIGRGLDHFSW